MRLKTITCSGANEHNAIEPLIMMLSKYPKAELGIQVSGKKAAFATARYWWLQALRNAMDVSYKVPVALHINSDWVERFCQGDIASELETWLNYSRLASGEPFIKRVQLNFKIGRETPDLKKMLTAIERCPHQRFIFSYNPENATFIRQVYETGLEFDLLYDSSHGEGILAESYPPPVFTDITQGYAGGLSAENVNEKLWQISKSLPIGYEFNIDAEGRLKGEDGHFSLEKARKYLKVASQWDAI